MSHYIPFVTDDGYHIGVMKSSSATPADADWDNQDNVILLAGQSKVGSLWSFEDSGDYHIATQQENGRVAYHVFDPGLDNWDIRDELAVSARDTPPPNVRCTMGLRADGDVIIYYMDVANLDYARREAGVWTTDILLTTSTDGMVAIGPDSSDRVTVVYGHGLDDIRTRSLNGANTLGTEVIIDADADNAIVRVGPGVIDSANLISVPYIDGSNDISVAQFTSATGPSDIEIKADVSDKNVAGHGAYTVQEVTTGTSLGGHITGVTGGTAKQAQSFKVNTAVEIISLTLRLQDLLTPTDDIEVSIQTNNTDEPSGTKLTTKTLDGGVITTTAADHRFNLPAAFLESGVTYWIVAERTGSRDASNVVRWIELDPSSSYADGNKSTFGATSVWTADTGADMRFSIDTVLALAPFCLALDGTDVHLIYSDEDVTTPTFDLFHDDDASVAGGGTETEVEDAVTAIRVSMLKGTSDLLYCFDDNGTLKYGTITLAGVAAPFPPWPREPNTLVRM